MPRTWMHPGPLAAMAVAGGLLAPATGSGQPAAPAPTPIAYPIRHAAHAAPAEGKAPRDVDLVVGVAIGGEARAYPLSLLWGESAHTVNDDLGRRPIAVALCPLARVAAAFDRRRGKETLDLGHVSRCGWTRSCSTTRAHARAGAS